MLAAQQVILQVSVMMVWCKAGLVDVAKISSTIHFLILDHN